MNKYDIVVSGAAEVSKCCENIVEISKEVGREVARQGCTLITGATTGVPYYAALGCNEAKGFNIGFSPAATEKSHIKTYNLPIEPFDIMVYTGADYVGRDVVMTKAADGVIIVCGRLGTLHEFVTAFETGKVIGVLTSTGGTADMIKEIMFRLNKRRKEKILYSDSPKELVKKVIEQIRKKKNDNNKFFK